MNAKIYKKGDNSFQVWFKDKHTKEQTWRMCTCKEDALKVAHELNVEYYSTHKLDLPKGITLDLTNKRFRFHIWIDNRTQKHICSSKDLQKVLDARSYLLANTYGN